MMGPASNLNLLNGVLAGPNAPVAGTPVADVLAGFDVAVQFSQQSLQVHLARSLAQNYLATLSAYVPWGTIPLPSSLVATMAPPFRLSLELRQARLELRLTAPYIAALHWPAEIAEPPGPVAAAHSARRLPSERTVDVAWRLEINVLTARPDLTLATDGSSPTGGGAPPSGRSGPPLAIAGDFTATPGQPPSGGGSWDRTTLATGTAATTARAALVVASDLWRFGMELDFAGTTPKVTSDAAAVNDFLATDAGRNMLVQALAPLEATAGTQLTPQVAPGGMLSPATVQSMHLPPFTVRDFLLKDAKGRPILCLCADAGSATRGAARLIQPMPGSTDFSYAVSQDVLGLALKTRWSLAASGLSIIGDVPVELPVGNDPHKTQPGHAQLQTTFSNILDDVAIRAATDGRGDPLRLMSRQRVQLLKLWDSHGNQITDLGPLADPSDEPFALPLYLFAGATGTPPQLQPNFRDLLLKLAAIMVFPLLQPLPAQPSSVSGFTSSAMKTLLIRWRLKSPRDEVGVSPGAGLEAHP